VKFSILLAAKSRARASPAAVKDGASLSTAVAARRVEGGDQRALIRRAERLQGVKSRNRISKATISAPSRCTRFSSKKFGALFWRRFALWFDCGVGDNHRDDRHGPCKQKPGLESGRVIE
jgi:hypothetical protein